MAVLFPIKLNGNKFFVNPTKIEVNKRSQISEVRTMGGTTFQVWPDLPDEVKFEGVIFGALSLFELRNLSTSIVQAPESKEVELVYKFKTYKGYVRDLNVSAVADAPRQFAYKFNFIVKDRPFVIEDMSLGQLTGLAEEFDFIKAQLRGASSVVANIPSNQLANILNVANSIGRIGLNIGRPQLPSISSFRP